jgi:hypothetical protein
MKIIKNTIVVCTFMLPAMALPNEKNLDYTVNPEVIKARLCNIEGPSVVKTVSVAMKPNFFFRYLTANQTTYFSSSEKQNYMLDTNSNDLKKIPGIHDPVPLWGEDVVTVPKPASLRSGGGVAMEFYRISDIKQDGHLAPAFYTDPQLNGVYQSIGQLGTPSADSYTNRVLTDDKGISFRDYQVKKVGEEVVAITPVGPVRNVCNNFKIKTPMISKDGREVAGFDAKSGTTKIWRIDEKKDNCELVEDLGYATGKVDFSFDGRYLTFHMNSSLETYSGTPGFLGISRYSRRPSKSRTTNIFVYDRKERLLEQLTFNSAINSYFPVWDKLNHVVYINYGNQGSMKFIVSSIGENGANDEYSMNAYCAEQSHQRCAGTVDYKKALMRNLLGETWLKICTNVESINPHMAMLTAKNIDQKKCKTIAEELYWGKTRTKLNKLVATSYFKYTKDLKRSLLVRWKNRKLMRQELEKLTAQDLLEVCELNQKTETTNIIPVQKTPAGLVILEQQCMSCHSNMPFENVTKLKEIKAENTTDQSGEKVDWAHASIIRMRGEGGHNKMPIGQELNKEDMETAITYLQQLTSSMELQK